MPNSFTAEIEYFFHEGMENVEECLRIAFESALKRGVQTIVIFTTAGKGPRIAIEKYRSQTEYSTIKIVAVTFPYSDRPMDAHLSPDTRKLFKENDIAIVQAHLPFNPMHAPLKGHRVTGQDMTLIGNALNIFGGSMSLCVQASLMACDAGVVELGEHVISITSDTAILVRSAPTERFLADFVVREVLCKPMSLTIIKGEPRLIDEPQQLTLEGSVESVGDLAEKESKALSLANQSES